MMVGWRGGEWGRGATYGGNEGESQLFGGVAEYPTIGEDTHYRHDLKHVLPHPQTGGFLSNGALTGVADLQRVSIERVSIEIVRVRGGYGWYEG